MLLWHDLLAALALVLIIEGAWPFIGPAAWRNMLLKIATVDDRTLRLTGLASMVAGLLILHLTS